MTGLPEVRKSFKVGLAVQTRYRHRADRRTNCIVSFAAFGAISDDDNEPLSLGEIFLRFYRSTSNQ